MYMCMHVSVRRVGSKGYLASYLTSDVRVRPVPPVHFVGWDHVLILVEVGGGDMSDCEYEYECKEGGVTSPPTLLLTFSQTRPAFPMTLS